MEQTLIGELVEMISGCVDAPDFIRPAVHVGEPGELPNHAFNMLESRVVPRGALDQDSPLIEKFEEAVEVLNANPLERWGESGTAEYQALAGRCQGVVVWKRRAPGSPSASSRWRRQSPGHRRRGCPPSGRSAVPWMAG